ncbi:MAG: hypothetical protein ACKPE6_12110, partial [Gammaproteobacteria bacterium]
MATRRRNLIRSLSLQQLIGISFTAGVLLLAVASSLVISRQSGETVQRRLQDEGMGLVESLATQSTLPLLYGDAGSAADAARSFLGFPDVQAVEILNSAGERIYASERAAPATADTGPTPARPTLMAETGNAWIFAAPVWSAGHSADSPFAEGSKARGAPELLGTVRLVMSRQTLS